MTIPETTVAMVRLKRVFIEQYNSFLIQFIQSTLRAIAGILRRKEYLACTSLLIL